MSYEKQTWINNISSVDEQKMNHIEDGIYQNSIDIEALDAKIDSKHIVMLSLHDIFTVTVNKNYTKLALVTDQIIGNKLSLSNDGGVLIGAGVNKVRITASMGFEVKSVDNRHMQVWRTRGNNYTVLSWRFKTMGHLNSTATYADTLGSETIVDVQENDVINLTYYCLTGDKIGGNAYGRRTSLTVEVIV